VVSRADHSPNRARGRRARGWLPVRHSFRVTIDGPHGGDVALTLENQRIVGFVRQVRGVAGGEKARVEKAPARFGLFGSRRVPSQESK
jgi:hypothetical protein